MIQKDFYVNAPIGITPDRAGADWAILIHEVNKLKAHIFPSGKGNPLNLGKTEKDFKNAVYNNKLVGKSFKVIPDVRKNTFKIRFVSLPKNKVSLDMSQFGGYIDNIIAASK